ncbi:MAG: hypothetical protein KKF30_06965 [Proteobacteria bacterium]|nr:hypothetical protein [Pseudomonadota bacterium]MBU4470060.1 hypothetical protein [Pseudomonadota bacterium]MCG2750705.1 hypothetical protein [Desulfobacteraceae bacterium]
MPQISLYIDEKTLKKIESAAKQQQVSISRWVADQIKSKIDPVYPVNFETLFGSIQDDTFVRPKTPAFENDTKRSAF